MSEYIERDTVLDGLENINWYHANPNGVLVDGSRSDIDSYIPYDEAEAMVNAIPAADVRENKRGVWTPIPIDEEGVNYFACSNCKYEVFISAKAMELVGFEEPHYCPNCGARMDGAEC